MWYGFFPYLRTKGRVVLEGTEFRSTRDLEGLSPDAQEAIQNLSAMFCLHDGSPIEEMTFAVIEEPGGSGEKHERAVQRVQRTQLLIAYVYTVPSRTGGTALNAQHASFFLFREERVVISLATPGKSRGAGGTLTGGSSGTGMEPGYHGIRDWTCQFWVMKGCRVYPEFPFFWGNDSTNVAGDLEAFFTRGQNWALVDLVHPEPSLSRDVLDRVFTSIRWYVASCRYSVEEAEAIVFLAIALESLLHVRQGDKLTERFKDAVLTVLGPVPRLQEWVDQFYAARSKTVHEGRPHQVVFVVGGSPSPGKGKKGDAEPITHRTLLAYGRRIYRMCLNAVVTGSLLAAEGQLADLFVHNSERLKRICELVNRKGASALANLLEASHDLCGLAEFGNEALGELVDIDLDVLWGRTKVVLQRTVDAIPSLGEPAKKIVAESGASRRLDAGQLDRLKELRSLLPPEVNRQSGADEKKVLQSVIQFLEYVLSPGVSVRVLLTSPTESAGGRK